METEPKQCVVAEAHAVPARPLEKSILLSALVAVFLALAACEPTDPSEAASAEEGGDLFPLALAEEVDPSCQVIAPERFSYDWTARTGQDDGPERVMALGVGVRIDGAEPLEVHVQAPRMRGATAHSSLQHNRYPGVVVSLGAKLGKNGELRDQFTLYSCGKVVERFSVLERSRLASTSSALQ